MNLKKKRPTDLLELRREATDLLDIAIVCEVTDGAQEYHVIQYAEIVMSTPHRHLAYRCAIMILQDALGGKAKAL